MHSQAAFSLLCQHVFHLRATTGTPGHTLGIYLMSTGGWQAHEAAKALADIRATRGVLAARRNSLSSDGKLRDAQVAMGWVVPTGWEQREDEVLETLRSKAYATWAQAPLSHQGELWHVLLLGGVDGWAAGQPIAQAMLREALALEEPTRSRCVGLPHWLLGQCTPADLEAAVSGLTSAEARLSKKPVFREDKLGEQFKAWQRGSFQLNTLVASFHNYFGSAEYVQSHDRLNAAIVYSQLVEPCSAQTMFEVMRQDISKGWRVFTAERNAIRAAQVHSGFVADVPQLKALLDDLETQAAAGGSMTIQFANGGVRFNAAR